MSENQQETKASHLSDEQAALKRKLVARIGLAGAMIVALLGTLAFFDYLNTPEEAAPAPPAFTEPVPVAKKDVTQPVKPAEPPAEEKVSVSAPAAQESSAAPIDKSIPPSPPAVAAQPALPRSEKAERGEKEKTSHAAPPASSARGSPPAHNVAPVAPAASGSTSRADEQRSSRESRGSRESPMAPVRVEEPAPARLFSGYALQAGVFSDVRRAEELHARLTLNGIPSSLEVRVQVGPFKTRAEADAARVKMKALGVDAVLLPPRGAAH